MCPLFAFLDNPLMLLFFGALAVLLFGERLPEVARSWGKGLMELKKGMSNIQNEIHDAINSSVDSSSSGKSSGVGLEPRYQPPADREEATAPKFEPPPEA